MEDKTYKEIEQRFNELMFELQIEDNKNNHNKSFDESAKNAGVKLSAKNK